MFDILLLLLEILGFTIGWMVVGLFTVTIAAYMEMRESTNLRTFGDYFDGLAEFNYSIASFFMLATVWPFYWFLGFASLILHTPDAIDRFFGRVEIGYLREKPLPKVFASKESKEPIESGISAFMTIQVYEEEDPKAKNYQQN